MNKEKQLKSPAKGVVKENKPKKQSTPAKSFKINSELKAMGQKFSVWFDSGFLVFQAWVATQENHVGSLHKDGIHHMFLAQR